MSRKANKYTASEMLWNNVAYVDQWDKIMVVYDDCTNLRAVVKRVGRSIYNVLLIGDDQHALYELNGIELGSTSKNQKACFNIYCMLQNKETPSFLPSCRRTQKINLHKIFPHTRVGAIRTGGFHVTNVDLSDKIAYGLDYYNKAIGTGLEVADIIYCDDDDNNATYPNRIQEGGITMYHVGCGAYCDEDGDNWEFF